MRKLLLVVLAFATLASAGPAAQIPQAPVGVKILPPGSYIWKPLRVGAGGWLTGLDIVSDGTKVVRTDTYGAYLWKSGTAQWDQLVTSLSMPASAKFRTYSLTEGVFEIRIAESNHNRLFMIWNGYCYRSDNRGATWTETAFPRRPDLDPNSGTRSAGQKMAIDPANADVVYVGTTSTGVWRSFDAGATWSQVTAITPGAAPGHAGMAFDASSGTNASGRTKVIVVPSYGQGVWRSTDAGTTWVKTTGGPINVWHAQVATDGIYWCVDRAALWKNVGGAWTNVLATAGEVAVVDPANPARIIVGALGGDGFQMRETLDRGATWVGDSTWYRQWPTPDHRRIANDIPWLAVTNESYMTTGDMRIDPSDGKLYFSQGIGVWQTTFPTTFVSYDWISQSKGIEQLVANSIWHVPGGATFLTAWDRPVFRSTDPDVFPSGHGPNYDRSIILGTSVEHALDDTNFLVLDAGWFSDEESSYSTNGGVSWTKFASYPPWGTAGMGHIAVSTKTNWVWVANANKVGYYTKNGGATWTALPSPVNVSTDWGQYLNRHIVSADRVTPNTFYLYLAAGAPGLYRSTNGGDSWTLVYSGHIVNGSDGFNARLRAVPGQAGHLFFTNGPYGGGDHVGPDAGELFKRSTNGGATWTAVPNVTEVYDFGFGKAAPGQTYPAVFIAGFVGGVFGVWRSDDNCLTWKNAASWPNDSLDQIKCIEGDMDVYGRVYVGFMGSGFAYGTMK